MMICSAQWATLRVTEMIRDKILGAKEDESSVHLDALDGDPVDLCGDLESDDSPTSDESYSFLVD